MIYIVQLTGNVIWSTSSLGSSCISYNRKKVAFSSLEQLMQSPEDLEEEEGQIIPMGDIALSFENVSICYKEYEPVKNLNFFCPKGTITVIVGESGIGKSSVFNAVLGFAEYSGRIKVWNKIVEKKNRKAVRQSISYMSEHNEMDEVTVEEAISFGEREISEIEKKEIADQVIEFRNTYTL